MKPEIFVVAFSLFFLGAYFTYTSHREGRDQRSSSIFISSGDYHEELRHQGKITFSDDEQSIKAISSGGEFSYIRNDTSLNITSTKNGALIYEYKVGDNLNNFDSTGRAFLASAVHAMLSWGVNSNERLDRLMRTGGAALVMKEVENMKNEEVKKMYFNRILQGDSGNVATIDSVLEKVARAFTDERYKQTILDGISDRQLEDSSVSRAYVLLARSMNDERMKTSNFQRVLDRYRAGTVYEAVLDGVSNLNDEGYRSKILGAMIDSLKSEQLPRVLMLVDSIWNEELRQRLLGSMLKKDTSFRGAGFENFFVAISHLHNDVEKKKLYGMLLGRASRSTEQWVSLLAACGELSNDDEKADLLLMIAARMPKGPEEKAAYVRCAKTITNDNQFGKAMRAVEL